MFTWTPTTLKCQIYENDVLIDLKTCMESELEAILACIYPYWKTSKESAIWFDIDIYEKHHLFKPTTRTMEIACYIHTPHAFSHRKQISISKVHYARMVGRKFPIEPKNTLYHTWKAPVEVAFVA